MPISRPAMHTIKLRATLVAGRLFEQYSFVNSKVPFATGPPVRVLKLRPHAGQSSCSVSSLVSCDRPLLGPVALFGQYNSLTEVEINHAFAK